MELREEVFLWLEKMNPSLLMMKGEVESLDFPEKIILEEGAEVLIIKGVDSVLYEEALDKNLFVLLIEEDASKISTFLRQRSFIPHPNLFLSTLDKEQLFPILKKFVLKKCRQKGNFRKLSLL